MNNSQQKTIMVVEDDKFLLKAYEVKLKSQGFKVIIARDGEEAIEHLKSGTKPDMMLLDLIMPRKRGLEVLTEVNENPEWKKIPVIILTNLGQDNDVKKGLDAGAKDYIVKSNISIEDVIKKINANI
jgi:DNA-binding response OmpR family regulator